jgi:hypothetical protein
LKSAPATASTFAHISCRSSSSAVEQLGFIAGLGLVFVTSDKRIDNARYDALLSSGVWALEFSFPDSWGLRDCFRMVADEWTPAENLLHASAGQT